MNLATTYLGLELTGPFMPGASPLATDLDLIKRVEDAGAGAFVMNSLFEEQIEGKARAGSYLREVYSDRDAEALSYLPDADDYRIDPQGYLDQIRKVKETCSFPVIGSLNGSSIGGWLEYAGLIEQAGADALELNIYQLSTDINESAGAIEQRLLDVVQGVSGAVKIPVAVKLSPYFSALPSLCSQIEAHGAKGLVLFNRFYQPDIDIEAKQAIPSLKLSDESELLLRLRWLAILSPQLRLDLAVSGGVHHATDAIKAIMTGATAVQLVSTLLYHGPEHIRTITNDLVQWLTDHGYNSLRDIRGRVNLARCADPTAFERANYLKVLAGWKPEGPQLATAEAL